MRYVQCRLLRPKHRKTVDNIAVASVEATLLQCCARYPRRSDRLLNEAIRQGLTTASSFARAIGELGGKGRAGTALARRLAEARLGWVGRTESELEDALIELLASNRIGLPQLQVPIVDASGTDIVRADFLFPATRTVFLTDGERWHNDPTSFHRDRTVANRLQAEGYSAYRFTWWHIDVDPAHIVEIARRASGHE